MGFQSKLIKTKIKTAIRKNYPDLKALLLRKYPSFVYGKNLKKFHDNIPIFVFHEVEPNDLEKNLAFLKENDYITLDCSEWFDCFKNPKMEYSKKILLTFDDGYISLWKHVYPLLRKYNYKAVSFICPGLILNKNKEEKDLTKGKRILCNWEEIRRMHESGCLDFQSHSIRHDLVFSSPKLYDFFNPHFVSHFFGKTGKAVVLQDCEDISLTSIQPYKDEESTDYFGTPIFTLSPRMAINKRFSLSKKVREHISHYVKANGNLAFFETKDWRRSLYREFLKFRKDELGRYVTGKEYQNEIAMDLKLSKEIIQEKLQGKKIQHFCAPWFKATEDVLKTAFSLGYVSTFLGEDVYSLKQVVNTNSGIVKVPRISGDYIYLLPGKGRKKLIDILTKKFFSSILNS